MHFLDSLTDIQKLLCVQNAAACLITRTRKYQHITPILIELYQLPVRQWILFKVLVLTYHALHNSVPPYIQSLLTKQSPTRSLHFNPKLTLVIFCSNTLFYGERAFSCLPPSQYNLLPEPLKLSPTLTAFKSGLKMYLFKSAYF